VRIDQPVCRGRAEGCTTNPHSFFGRLTPEEWAELMYKHLDHHSTAVWGLVCLTIISSLANDPPARSASARL